MEIVEERAMMRRAEPAQYLIEDEIYVKRKKNKQT